MNLEHLEYFMTVAQTGSINRAAQALFISQPHLGKIIRDLEQSAGLMRDSYWSILQRGDEVGRSYHGFTGKTRGKPIDYIFTSRDLTLRQVELRREGNEGQFPSDHYPVVAQVEL